MCAYDSAYCCWIAAWFLARPAARLPDWKRCTISLATASGRWPRKKLGNGDASSATLGGFGHVVSAGYRHSFDSEAGGAAGQSLHVP